MLRLTSRARGGSRRYREPSPAKHVGRAAASSETTRLQPRLLESSQIVRLVVESVGALTALFWLRLLPPRLWRPYSLLEHPVRSGFGFGFGILTALALWQITAANPCTSTCSHKPRYFSHLMTEDPAHCNVLEPIDLLERQVMFSGRYWRGGHAGIPEKRARVSGWDKCFGLINPSSGVA